jgi:hypothetical protein
MVKRAIKYVEVEKEVKTLIKESWLDGLCVKRYPNKIKEKQNEFHY